jgi:hypothetical protein
MHKLSTANPQRDTVTHKPKERDALMLIRTLPRKPLASARADPTES